MTWTPDRWEDTEDVGFRPCWIGSTAYNSLHIPMEPEEEETEDDE